MKTASLGHVAPLVGGPVQLAGSSAHSIARHDVGDGPSEAPAAPADEAPPTSGVDRVDVMPSRQPTGLSFHFKVAASGRIYVLHAARDPGQPRFWRLRICRCASAGIVDATQSPWYMGDAMTREDLPAAVAAVREAPSDWLALPQHTALRAWVMEAGPIASLQPSLAPRTRPRMKTE